MTIGQTKRIRRAIMAALQPLTGSRATATATVNLAAGHTADVVIPKNCYAFPIPSSVAGVAQVDDQRILRVDTEVAVTSAGPKTVNLTSLMGGKWHNALEAGTRILWSPPIHGIETHSVLATTMSGGTSAPEVPGIAGQLMPGFVRDVTSFYDITATDVATQLFLAKLANRVPSIVVRWTASEEGAAKGRGSRIRPDRWWLFVITENRRSEGSRRDNASDIMDGVEELLSDKRAVDGFAFSDPPCVVTGRRPLSSTESSLVHVVTLSTFNAARRLDLRVTPHIGMDPLAGFANWDTTRITGQTTDDPAFVTTGPVVVNQQQAAHDAGHSNGHA